VLVNAQGRTLYIFVPDKDKKVTCVGSCAHVWSPTFLANTARGKATGQGLNINGGLWYVLSPSGKVIKPKP
jgi:predicted lipoprotein with Yx(FWY)xxD motif